MEMRANHPITKSGWGIAYRSWRFTMMAIACGIVLTAWGTPVMAQSARAEIISYSAEKFLPDVWSPLVVRIRNNGVADWITLKPVSIPTNWELRSTDGSNPYEVRKWLERNEVETFGFEVKPATAPMSGTIRWEVWGTTYNEFPQKIQTVDQAVTIGYAPSAFNLVVPTDDATDVSVTPTFQWQTATWAETYRLKLFQDAGGQAGTTIYESEPLQTNNLTFPGPNLEYETPYWWKVTATNSLASTENTGGAKSFTTIPVPQLGTFNISIPTHNYRYETIPYIVWSQSTGATYYSVRIFEDVNGVPKDTSLIQDYNVTATSWPVPQEQLTKGNYYWVKVTAFASGSGIVVPKPAANSPVRFLYSGLGVFTLYSPEHSSAAQDLRPTFRWQASTKATGYRIEIRGAQSSNMGFKFTDTSATTVYPYAGPTLSPGSLYSWTVTAIGNGEELHTISNDFLFVTAAVAPFHLISPSYGEEGIPVRPVFTWERAVGEITYGIQLEVWIDNATEPDQLVHQVFLPQDATSHAFDNPFELKRGQLYYWRVRARASETTGRYNEGGNHPFRVTRIGTFNLLEPLDLKIKASTHPVFRWQPASNAESYVLLLYLANPTTYSPIGNPVKIVYDIATPEYTYQDPPYLTGNTEYTWQVYAMGDGHYIKSSSTDFRFKTDLARHLMGEGVMEALLGRGRLVGEDADISDVNLDDVIDVADWWIWWEDR